MSRQTIVAANWKMNGDAGLIKAMANGLNDEVYKKNHLVIICPPFPYLAGSKRQFDNPNVFCGAQNISQYEKGAYTGEISALMLQDLQVQYVIIGHSERRALFNDSSEIVAEKVAYSLDCGLTPIFCIGETLEDRELGTTKERLQYELAPVVRKVGIERFEKVIVAYEPLWAVGTGKVASVEVAQESHEFIRAYLAKFDADIAQRVSILYGGSVNSRNCKELFAQQDIDGGLIGGASLQVEEFKKICQAV